MIMKGQFTFTISQKELTEMVQKYVREKASQETHKDLPETISVDFVIKRTCVGFTEQDQESVTAQISFNTEL